MAKIDGAAAPVADLVRHLLRLFRSEEPRRRQKDEDKDRRIEQHLGRKSALGPGFSTGFTEIDPIAGAPVHRGLKVSDGMASACWSKTSCGSSLLASVAVSADFAEQDQQAPHRWVPLR